MTAAPSVSNSITVLLELPARATAVSELTTAIERSGGLVTGLDVTASGHQRLRVDVTAAARDQSHAEDIVAAMRAVHGVEILKVSDRTFLVHLGGKLTIESKAGQGTTLRMTLPRSAPRETPLAFADINGSHQWQKATTSSA
jgi:malate dehydrogenase (oxaloacetate-decarboxylating)